MRPSQGHQELWTLELGPGTSSQASFSPAELHDLGGKGAGLHRLQQAGVRIPPTLCVRASRVESMCREALVKAQNIEEMRAFLLQAKLSPALTDELSAWIRGKDVVRWCVRSSSVEEDGTRHSFAGQHLTLHDVMGWDALLDAIRRVMASAYSDHALLYRHRTGAGLVPRGMAVLIQPMLTPYRAGVAFSRDPEESEEGARRGGAHHPEPTRVLSVARGMGTGVVDGSSETVTYYVESRSRYVRCVEGTTQGDLAQAKLEPDELNMLLDMLDEIVQRAPQSALDQEDTGHDVEWALVRGGAVSARPILYVLQWRPLTAPLPSREAPGPSRDQVYTNANVGEALPGVGSPLTWSVIHRFSRKGFEQAFASLGLSVPRDEELVRSFHGRVYLNLTRFMEIASAVPWLKPTALFELAGGGGAREVEGTYEKRSPWRFLFKLPLTTARVASSQLLGPSISSLWEVYFSRKREDFFLKDLSRSSTKELRALWERTEALFDRNGLVMLAASSNFLLLYVVWRELLRFWGGEQALEQEQLFLGGLKVKSAEPGLELLRMGRLARRSLRIREIIESNPAASILDALVAQRASSAEVADFLRELEHFRERYGHRAPREAELSTPRWREDTTFLFEVLKGFVEAPSLVTQRELDLEQREREKEKERALNRLFSGLNRRMVRAILKVVRGSAQRREALRALVVDALDMYRVLALECGHRLVKQGLLASAEDVFFLELDEIRAWLERPDDIERSRDYRMSSWVRRVIHEHQLELSEPPGTFILRDSHRIIPITGMTTSDIAPGEEARSREGSPLSKREGTWTLYGLPGSRGTASGRARVLSDPSQRGRLEHGDVLVVPYADVGWTPLFLSAGAVVMSLGGPLSHACVVAREYGIPVVANATEALDVIEDGDWLMVDGDRGVVMVERRAPGSFDEER